MLEKLKAGNPIAFRDAEFILKKLGYNRTHANGTHFVYTKPDRKMHVLLCFRAELKKADVRRILRALESNMDI